jgi:PAS domain S-box-containing protein
VLNTKQIHVLLVEQDTIALTESVFQLQPCPTLATALDRLARETLDVVIFPWDQRTFEMLHSAAPRTPLIALTPSDAVGEIALEAGVHDYLVQQDLTPRLLKRSLRYALDRQQFQQARVEADLSHQQARYQALLLDHMSDAVIGTDMNFTVQSWNRAAASMYGWQTNDITGQNWLDVTKTQLDKTQRANIIQQLIEHGQWHGEVIQRKKDRSIINVMASTTLLTNNAGEPIGMVMINRDVTERKWVEQLVAQAHTKSNQERRLLRAVLETLPVGVVITDAKGRITHYNRQMVDLWGATPHATNLDDYKAFVGWWYGTQERVKTDEWALMRALLKGETVQNNEITLQRSDGQHIVVLHSAAPIKNANREITGSVGILTDITERKIAQRQTMELTVERERVKVLSDFIRDASHDFKTPISTINTSLYLLKRLDDPDKIKQQIEVAERQTDRLIRLLDGLLTMIRLDQEATFNFQPTHINPLVQHDLALQIDGDAVAAKHLTLRFDLAESLPPVQANQGELCRALLELINNAIQFTPDHGVIEIKTYRSDAQVVIEVRDTGIGIAPDVLPHIFQRLYRADPSRSSETGGVGLGLPIAQKIIEAHRGTIEVSSEVGSGSVFRVMLPIGD